jgi:hypothetical protein
MQTVPSGSDHRSLMIHFRRNMLDPTSLPRNNTCAAGPSNCLCP